MSELSCSGPFTDSSILKPKSHYMNKWSRAAIFMFRKWWKRPRFICNHFCISPIKKLDSTWAAMWWVKQRLKQLFSLSGPWSNVRPSKKQLMISIITQSPEHSITSSGSLWCRRADMMEGSFSSSQLAVNIVCSMIYIYILGQKCGCMYAAPEI